MVSESQPGPAGGEKYTLLPEIGHATGIADVSSCRRACPAAGPLRTIARITLLNSFSPRAYRIGAARV